MLNRIRRLGVLGFFKERIARLTAPFSRDVQVWKHELVNGILRSALAIVVLLLASGSYYAYSSGLLWLIPFYAILVGLWIFMTFLPKAPYVFRALSLLVLIYAVSVLDFFESGRTGSGRVFLLTLPVLSLLFFDMRAGMVMLGISIFTLGGFGWLYATARLSVPPEIANSTDPAIWLSNSAVFSFATVLLMASVNYLIRRFSQAVVNLKASVDETEDLLSLQQTVFDATVDGILAVDRAGKITTFNRRFVELWKIPGSIVDSRDDDAAIAAVLVQLEDPTVFTARIEALYAYSQEHSDDLLRLKDGRVFERYSRPQWLGGEVVGRVWVFRDITAQKQAEETLKQSQRNFNLFFNTIDDLLFVLDDQGNMLHVNQTVCRKLGYSEAELIGQPVLMVHPQEQRAEAGRIVAAMLAGKEELCSIPVMTKDGRQIPVETRVIAGEWDGRPAIFGVTRDMSLLKLSEEKFSRAFNAGSVLMAIATVAEGRYVDVNDVFLNTFGLTREQVIGKTDLELDLFVDPEDRDTIARLCEENGWFENFQARMRGKGGAICWGLFFGTRIQVGGEACWLITMTDITDLVHSETERRQAEASLARRAMELRKLYESSLDINAQPDMPTLWQKVVERVVALTGMQMGSLYLLRPDQTLELVAQHNLPAEYVYTEYLGTRLHLGEGVAGRAAQEGKPMMVEDYRHWEERATVFDKIGARRVLSVPLKTRNRIIGALNVTDVEQPGPFTEDEIRLLGLFADQAAVAIENAKLFAAAQQELEERKRAEHALRISEARFRALTENANDMIFILDAEGILQYVSSSVNRVMGYTPETLVGQSVFSLLHPEDAVWMRDRWPYVLAHPSVPVETRRTRVRHADGAWHVHEGIGRNLMHEPGIAGFVLNTRDVTERVRQEDERERLITELGAKNAELERFTYTVSHDLKSPLITIGGFVGFLEKDALAGDMVRVSADVERINDAVARMQRLLGELLELSRIGRLMNPPEPVPLGAIVQEAVELVGGCLTARGVAVDIASDLPVVRGDRARLVEVLQNLVDNACKFMGDQPEPRIEIGVQRDGDETIFYVRDNGIGIDSRYHDKVFGLFDKLDPNSEGTGVGLALVKRIVETHGGRIWVESEGFDHGSTFYFTLTGGIAKPS